MQYSEKLYKEAIYDKDYLSVEMQATISWKCEDCGDIFIASPFARFHKQASCPYYSGKIAIPEKTSLKALYTELIDREWKFQNNTLRMNPRYELPASKKRAWWICPICNKTYIYPINRRIKDYLRNRNSCTICKGRVRVKYRN
ncbi:zinc-ribbon domain-containing protein [Aminipila butyrica]|uniref:Zinc-ribbon domain-containing protein n=1 Tax=Aminipila butyrica TaxID=433296 RepID=A0A858BZB6_9FIRM|nr:zinc-ribbon domain-containing protein [Aminipila butyrica]QIB69426.1 zinc-ribbon domain-containing protein [Aminipila butyrica]